MSVILADPQTSLISVRHLKSIITNLFLTKSNFPRQNSACLHFVKNIWVCQQFFVNNRFYQAGQSEPWPAVPSFNPSTQSHFFPRVICPLQIAVFLKSYDSSVFLPLQILPCVDLTLVSFSLCLEILWVLRIMSYIKDWWLLSISCIGKHSSKNRVCGHGCTQGSRWQGTKLVSYPITHLGCRGQDKWTLRVL